MSLQDKIKNAEVSLWPYGMGMTIDEATKHLDTYSSTNGSGQTTQAQHEEAKRVAMDTMRKYEKIQEIFDRYDKGELTHNMFGLLVGEVIEDGKND